MQPKFQVITNFLSGRFWGAGHNDPQLYLDHRIAKIKIDLYVPLAHLNNYTKYGNIVERAIRRQMQRVADLPPVSDGYKYLFRGKDINGNIETINYDFFRQNILVRVSNGIPLVNYNNEVYIITAHQFRHTVATEMIEAGVGMYATKEFLGHKSLAMTDRYIRIYNERLKKEFKEKLTESCSNSLISHSMVTENYNSKWLKEKIAGVLELGDGCCEHLYKMPSCPQLICKTCLRKKIYPRHLNAVKMTIDEFTNNYNNALSLGLVEKAQEFKNIVDYYTVALKYIEKNQVFEASKHIGSKES